MQPQKNAGENKVYFTCRSWKQEARPPRRATWRSTRLLRSKGSVQSEALPGLTGGPGGAGEQGGLASLSNGGLWATGLSLGAWLQALNEGRGDGPPGAGHVEGVRLWGGWFASRRRAPWGPFAISETWFVPGGHPPQPEAPSR